MVNMFKHASFRVSISVGILALLFLGIFLIPFSTLIRPAYAAQLQVVRKWQSPSLASGGYEGGFAIGDVDHSTPGEEVVAARTGYIYLLDGRTGSKIWQKSDSAVGKYSQPSLYDLNNDGNLEVLVPLYYPCGLVVLFSNGSQYWRVTYSGGATEMSSLAAVDVDGDGHLEIFMSAQDVVAGSDNAFNGRIRKFSYNGTLLAQSFSWRTCSGGVSIADTDNDGEFEVYTGDRDVYYGDGDYGKGARSFWASNLTLRWTHPDVLCSSQCPVLADVNKDGVLDFIVSNMRGGLLILNTTNGKPFREQTVYINPPYNNLTLPGHYQITVYDIDGDGNLEVITQDGSHPGNSWPNDEFVIFDLVTWEVQNRVKIGASGGNQSGQFSPTLADVNGDGIMEILACHSWGLQIFDRNCNLLFNDSRTAYGQFALVQDIDNDGLLEIVVGSSAAYIYAWDTNTPKPAQRPRTEVKWYSEYRRGAAEYIAPPSKAGQKAPTTNMDAGAGAYSNSSYGQPEVQSGQSDWWNAGWPLRKTVTISHGITSSDQTDFPLLIDTIDGDLSTKAQSNGNDIVFTDNLGNELNHEIESYDSISGHLVCWVKVPLLSSASDTILYLYYGNSTVPNQQNPTAVWDSRFKMVQHLEEKSGTFYDSTGNHNDGSPQGGMSQNSPGKVNGAAGFDGSNDYVNVPHSETIAGFTEAFTASFWVNFASVTGRRTLLNKYADTGSQRAWYIDYDPSRGLGLFVSQDGVSYRYYYGSFSPTVGVWYQIAIVWQSGLAGAFFVNGQQISTTYSSGTITSIYNNAGAPLYIGRSYATNRYFTGTIDEVRISDKARSASWINTCYTNQQNPSAFISFGPEIPLPPPGAPNISAPSPVDGATGISINLPSISFTLSDPDGDLMDYNVTTNPNVGSDSQTGKPDGTYNLPLSGPIAYDTTYRWEVDVTDPLGSGQLISKSFTFNTEPEPSSWPLPGWAFRKELRINGSLISGNLLNFPVLVNIVDGDLSIHARTNGDDIVFTDSLGNKLDHEIEKFDNNNGGLVAWVRVPNLAALEDKILYMYYGNPIASNQQNPEAVWDADFGMVQHLEGTSGLLTDSTFNNNDGSAMNGVTQGSIGRIDGADFFDGTDDYISIPHSATVAGFTQAFTASFWVRFDSVTGRRTLINKYTNTGNQRGWYIDYDSSHGLGLFVSQDGTTFRYYYGALTPSAGTWYQIVVVWQSNLAGAFFVNGRQVTTTYSSGTVSSIYNNSNAPLYIGRSYVTDRNFAGSLDEVSISDVARSFDWINTCYNSQQDPSTFMKIGTEETSDTYPKVVNHLPLNDEVDVPVTTTVQITFSEPMNQPLTEDAFSLDSVDGTFSWSANGKTMTFVPSSSLAFNTVYTAIVTKNAADSQGDHMSSDYSWSFTTKTPDPLLVSSSGTNTTDENLTCYAPPGWTDNLYNWYVDNGSLTNLLLSFDTNETSSVSDYSPYNNDGVIHGATWIDNGIMGGAYHFNGEFDYIKIPDGKIDNVTNLGYFNGYPFQSTLGGDGSWSEITVELWIYLDKDQNDTRFVAKLPSFEIGLSSGNPNRLFATIFLQNGTDHTELGFLGTSTRRYSNYLSTATWHHVAFTYKSGVAMTLYVDGQAVSNSTSVKGNIHCSSGEPLYLGWYNYFAGMIDEVRIYPECLSAEQISLRYSETKNGGAASSSISSQDTLGMQTWKCQVFQGQHSKFSNTLQIVNTPPVAGNLTFGPHQLLQPCDSDNLIAIYDYYDADSHSESGTEIQWYRNGTLMSAYNNLMTLPASATSIGDLWKYTVRPRDGYDFGETVASSEINIIANLPPDIVGQPILVENNGNITCSTTMSDADGLFPTTGIYNWYVNNVALTNLQMTFDTDNKLAAKDYSPYGNNGTINGATWTPNGLSGGAYDFDGGNDGITVADSNSLGASNTWTELTIEFWIKPNSLQYNSRIIAKKDPNAGTRGTYMIYFNSNSTSTNRLANVLVFGILLPPGPAEDNELWVSVGANLTAWPLNTPLNVGEWYHVVCTYKSGVGLVIYVNGTERARQSATGAIQQDTYRSGDEPLYIGYDPSGRYLNGTLDEIRIYPRALTPEQIVQRYKETKNGASTSQIILYTETNPGQVWRCQVVPNDRYQDGTPEYSNQVTISN
jgi:hypothetical protein